MHLTSDIDKMNKLVSLCPNGNLSILKPTLKSTFKAEFDKSKQKNEKKNMQKVGDLTNKTVNTKKNKNAKFMMGCACKPSTQSYEYCSVVQNILERIEKLQLKTGVKNSKELNISAVNEDKNINLKASQCKHIPIAQKNLYKEYCDDSFNIPDRNGNHNSLTVDNVNCMDKTCKNIKCNKLSKINCSKMNEIDQCEYPIKVDAFEYRNSELFINCSKLEKKKCIHSTSRNPKAKLNYGDLTNKEEKTINHQRTNSNPAKNNNENLLLMIEKDLKRTFQHNKYFKKEHSQCHLRQILIFMASQNGITGYLQGMNFIGGCIIFHCNNFIDAAKIFAFLMKNMQMEEIYSFIKLEKYINVLKKLLEIHVNDFFTFSQDKIQLDYHIHLIDWFFCLGLNKIPLEYSHHLLENIIIHGWYYFYRVLINYFKLFEEKYRKIIKAPKINENKKLDMEVNIKNFHKDKCLNWESLLKKSVTSPLNDIIIKENLGWETRDRFTKPALKI